jgi:CBS domain containing-hemolysin-like protein
MEYGAACPTIMDIWQRCAPGSPGAFLLASTGPEGSVWTNTGYILAAVVLVLLNGFFVAAEFAIVKVRPTRIDELASQGSFAARTAQHAVKHLDAYLSATQLGITLTSLALGWIGEPAFARLLKPLFAAADIPESLRHQLAIGFGFFIITFLHIVFGELAPKSLAIRKSQSTALAVAWPLHLFYALFKPLILLMNGAANLVLRAGGIEPATEREMVHSPQELDMIVAGSQKGGTLEATEAEIAREALDLHERTARDAMVPRVDIAFLSTEWPVEECIRTARSAGFTRFPLCDPDPDTVIGMVHVKDLFALANRPTASVRDVRRDILMVPETKPLDSLLRQFQSSRIHMAIVLDEYGGTLGLITLEDVLEEIVGDIQDEHQHEPPEMEPAGEGAYRVDGGISLEDLGKDLGIAFEPSEAETLGGYLQWRLGAVPEAGQSVRADGFLLTVQEMDGRRVRAVLVQREASGS